MRSLRNNLLQPKDGRPVLLTAVPEEGRIRPESASSV